MQLTPLDNKSYPLYVVMNYRPRKILDLTSFNKDVKLFKNVKLNINRYYKNRPIDFNLLTNQIIILQNQFQSIAVSRILFFLVDKNQHHILASLLIHLGLFDRKRILEIDKHLKHDAEVLKLLNSDC